MPSHKSKNSGSGAPPPPPPPRPDPVTLEQIYAGLTAADVAMEERAYFLVALSTVAFHPSVKLFLFEHTPLHVPVANSSSSSSDAGVSGVAAENTRRREAVLKNIAFFLAQRNSAVAQECRWETVALLGELCRLESLNPLRPGGGGGSSSSVMSPQQEVVQKINHYARANLEFLTLLPWFVPAVRELIGEDAGNATTSEPSSSSAVRRAARRSAGAGSGEPDSNGVYETDEDVRIALKDILAALPEVQRDGSSGGGDDGAAAAAPTVAWSAERLDQAHDLMFLDASTTMLHLIPLVSRSSHTQCAHCEKRCSDKSNNGGSLLRCGSCKAVYYCDATCQRAHWASAHRTPCKCYKQLVDDIQAEYEALNKKQGGGGGSSRKKKQQQQQQNTVTVLEVPLEPSLFYATRRYLYDHRDASFSDVSFMDYFMKYTVRGS
ncbi:MYND zinc finger (ZnF) domain-like protein [Trypanosoma grayi]|uniref:MYND zinc finger (ZnF) domain-like protein n=1 Tax=Trypanosoma grayi TaxID=71804 RepID=UPI0004F4757E|nr:MYND zinc finger (ZnF) domain-like protein [Trypanosoma grayi]KEG06042.1 MYND zinc finger (ZnF) domain-like protein [Trypanosoma grayi]